MARTQYGNQERAKSRGTEGTVVIAVVVGTLVAVVAAVGSQLAHLVGGLSRAMP